MNRVEIPLIQRDYAQGRRSAAVQLIRRDFLDVLVDAIAGRDPVDLDFVYGDIENGTLRPLDGQQRLTTLFLIHWYLAARTQRLAEAGQWLRFTYATRPTAELFCRQIVNSNHQPNADFAVPSEWITNQAWYLFAWRHDPTIQSMLVMLDAIHYRLSGDAVDLDAAWKRLTDTDKPAICFHFLPIDDLPSGEELYIKMNSRGKPLTEFENFKARFERILKTVLPPMRFNEIVHKLDGTWTDVLWANSEDVHTVDDEFLRYFEFVFEVCEWRSEAKEGGRLLEQAERIFSDTNPNFQRDLDFLFHAFDTWASIDTHDFFAAHFARSAADSRTSADRVTLFESRDVNLFQECCRRYGQMNRHARLFSLSETLLLFALLIHRQYDTEDFSTRIRILRNLTDLADEVRENRMTDLIDSVETLIRFGAILDLKGFNTDRIADEQLKREFLSAHPDQTEVLYALEEHPLLRGRVFAFDLDSRTLASRAAAFTVISQRKHWPQLTAALLAKGDYGFQIMGGRGYQLGTMHSEQELRWREIFTRHGREKNGELPFALGALLDAVAMGTANAEESLDTVAGDFVQERFNAKEFDWRYYLVKYPAMREGATGIFLGEHLAQSRKWRYSMCMLRTGSLSGGALYRDPYLLAIWRESRVAEAVRDPWYSGYEFEPRWLRLNSSYAGVRCVSTGFVLEAPNDEEQAKKFRRICEKHRTTCDFLPIAQKDRNGELIDTEDRVQRCTAFIRDLVAVGL